MEEMIGEIIGDKNTRPARTPVQMWSFNGCFIGMYGAMAFPGRNVQGMNMVSKRFVRGGYYKR